MFKQQLLLFNTVKYLKFSQIINRIKRKLIKPRIDFSSAPETSLAKNNLKPVIKCQQKMFGKRIFKFLNKEFNLKDQADWNAKSQEKLWLYNLHYFDELNSFESDQRNLWHCEIIKKWINENPPGIGNGWEPYPISLRIVNWIKWSLLNVGLDKDALDSLAIQTRYLGKNIEYHLLGNHIFANAKALIFAGLYFHGPEATKWYKSGLFIFKREIEKQVLDDGGNFELSPMYHAIFLEDLLDIINIHQVYEIKITPILESKVIKMLGWLENMCHPDGEIAFFNDTTLDIAPTKQEISKYASRLNISHNNNQLSQLTYLKESGYIRFNREDLTIIADVAEIGPSYIPGHGHADALSFELSLFGERVLVNSGISTYESGPLRSLQRGTKAHSTLTIDNIDSSQVWGGFRVAKRAKVFNVNNTKTDEGIKFSACHDGYSGLKGNPIHCREWRISGNSIEIIDIVTGGYVHEIVSVFPLHPEVTLNNFQQNSVEIETKKKKIKVIYEGIGLFKAESAQYYPNFGKSVDNKQLICSYNGNLPFKATLKISW
tara:strand:- start:1310 stop:2944 length:1635 start_codon:yes stop_codon:yes gene_type:complete